MGERKRGDGVNRGEEVEERMVVGLRMHGSFDGRCMVGAPTRDIARRFGGTGIGGKVHGLVSGERDGSV